MSPATLAVTGLFASRDATVVMNRGRRRCRRCRSRRRVGVGVLVFAAFEIMKGEEGSYFQMLLHRGLERQSVALIVIVVAAAVDLLIGSRHHISNCRSLLITTLTMMRRSRRRRTRQDHINSALLVAKSSHGCMGTRSGGRRGSHHGGNRFLVVFAQLLRYLRLSFQSWLLSS